MDRMMEFKDQSVEELKTQFEELSRDIFTMKNELSTTRKIEKPHLLIKKKKDRARVLTLLRQKGEKVG